MLYANKRLQKTKLYKELHTLQDSYYRLSLSKEENQQSFLKRLVVTSETTGKVQQLHYSFEKYYKGYTKSIEQKVYALEQVAKDQGLVPVFITLTLPSTYHPFQSINYDGKRLYTNINPDFAFDNIEEAVSEGYQYLNHIYRTFYKRVKNVASELLYIKVVENHKTMLPHFHVLFYVKREKVKIIRKLFDKISAEFNLRQAELEITDSGLHEKETDNVKVGINRASKYIMKYITKTLSSGEDYYKARILDGWKRKHKIRMITMSNLDLSLAEFRTIYKNLDEENKNELLEKAKENEVNLFYYIMKNLYRLKRVYKNGTAQIKQFGKLDSSKIKLFESVTRSKNRGGYHYMVDSFSFFINNNIFEKEKYQRMILRS